MNDVIAHRLQLFDILIDAIGLIGLLIFWITAPR